MWKAVKLGDVCDFQNGFAFKSKLFKETGNPILRISNIQNEKIDTRKIVYFNPNDYNTDFTQYEVKPNDLLIAMSGATTCLLYTSPSPRDGLLSRMPSSA